MEVDSLNLGQDNFPQVFVVFTWSSVYVPVQCLQLGHDHFHILSNSLFAASHSCSTLLAESLMASRSNYGHEHFIGVKTANTARRNCVVML
jgi:hypothetical protein